MLPTELQLSAGSGAGVAGLQLGVQHTAATSASQLSALCSADAASWLLLCCCCCWAHSVALRRCAWVARCSRAAAACSELAASARSRRACSCRHWKSARRCAPPSSQHACEAEQQARERLRGEILCASPALNNGPAPATKPRTNPSQPAAGPPTDCSSGGSSGRMSSKQAGPDRAASHSSSAAVWAGAGAASPVLAPPQLRLAAGACSGLQHKGACGGGLRLRGPRLLGLGLAGARKCYAAADSPTLTALSSPRQHVAWQARQSPPPTARSPYLCSEHTAFTPVSHARCVRAEREQEMGKLKETCNVHDLVRFSDPEWSDGRPRGAACEAPPLLLKDFPVRLQAMGCIACTPRVAAGRAGQPCQRPCSLP